MELTLKELLGESLRPVKIKAGQLTKERTELRSFTSEHIYLVTVPEFKKMIKNKNK